VNLNEIDRALRDERRIEPTDDFRSQVMQAVRAQHAACDQRRRIEFHQFWPSIAVASVVVPLLFAVRLLDGPESNARDIVEVGRWLFLTLSVTLAGVWWFAHDMVGNWSYR